VLVLCRLGRGRRRGVWSGSRWILLRRQSMENTSSSRTEDYHNDLQILSKLIDVAPISHNCHLMKRPDNHLRSAPAPESRSMPSCLFDHVVNGCRHASRSSLLPYRRPEAVSCVPLAVYLVLPKLYQFDVYYVEARL
jgi:hypothetical protein